MKARLILLFLLATSAALTRRVAAAETLPGTAPLTMEGDLSAQMVAGIDRFAMREIERSVEERQKFWKRDFSSREAYEKSVDTNRVHLAEIMNGAIHAYAGTTALEFVSKKASEAKLAETDHFNVFAVHKPLFGHVHLEGLLLQPKGVVKGRVVAIPDADQTPEMIAGLMPGVAPESQFARRLAEAGCEVLVPVLIDRRDQWSGRERFTNQPHREWIYRQAYELGQHIISYEVQKVVAAVTWFASSNAKLQTSKLPIGVAGYGEGGLIALYAAALDTRIDATMVSGYFDSRQRVWEEPIYRNVFGLLREFGDAEIASLIAPRTLVIEYSESPKIAGPPKPREGRAGAAPGKWQTPEFSSVEREVNRAKALVAGAPSFASAIQFADGSKGASLPFGSAEACGLFLRSLGVKEELPKLSAGRVNYFDQIWAEGRQMKQVKELEDFTQDLLRHSAAEREASFWSKLKPADGPEAWAKTQTIWRSNFWETVIGKFPPASLPPNPRSRKIYDKEKWTGYDVVLDVWPDVFAWGVLLLPKDLKPGERRPVVVCQHGLEGVPDDTITDDTTKRAYGSYKAFSARLAERGFIVFAPHNPYRGQDNFRVLQRKLNPLGKSLFSVIIGQHERILDWLSAQPFVDPKRIGFYGLSYGGKSAMRIPAALDRYCLSICSADFNEWVWKNATVDWRGSYMFTGEYEIFEWNLGHTFNYAEMAALIAPRPFMVERGHDDGVGLDEWVAYEYAKVRRFYDKLGVGDRTEIEFFNGPHTINGQGTYDFLHRHLNWPKR
jgi:dienelactone hydrolase